MQRNGAARRHGKTCPGNEAGERQLRHPFRRRHDGGENGGRVGANDHGHRHGLAGLQPLPMMLRAAAHRQPAHDGARLVEHLHAVGSKIIAAEIVGARRAGDHQRPGDQRAGVAGPTRLDGQRRKVDGQVAPAPAIADDLRPGVERRPRHRPETARLAQRARRLRRAQEGHHATEPGEPRLIGAEAGRNAGAGAEQVGDDRHRRRFAADGGRGKPENRSAGLDHPPMNFRDLQPHVDRRRHIADIAPLVQEIEKAREIGKARQAAAEHSNFPTSRSHCPGTFGLSSPAPGSADT